MGSLLSTSASAATPMLSLVPSRSEVARFIFRSRTFESLEIVESHGAGARISLSLAGIEIKMFQPNPQAIPFAIAAVVSGAVAVFAWRRRTLPMAPAFFTMMAGEAAWALFEALELVCKDVRMQALCYELRTAGAVITILGLLAFVLRYTGSSYWLEPRRFAAIYAPALAMIGVAWTNPLHHLYWFTHLPRLAGPFHIAIPVYGPGFWVQFSHCYFMVAVSAFLLAQAAVQSGGVYRAQAAVMLFAVLVPWVVNVIDMTQVLGYVHVDTAAMTFAITGLAFLPGLFRYRLLDLTPVAWAVVVKGMNDPVIVFDPFGRIVELNQAAVRLVGRPYAELIGADAAGAFAHWSLLAGRLRGLKGGRRARLRDRLARRPAAVIVRRPNVAARRKKPCLRLGPGPS